MTSNSLHDFAEHLADNLKLPSFSQADAAVALMWFHQHEDNRSDSTVAELANELEGLDLTNKLNRTRLKDRLRSHKSTKTGKSSGTFTLKRDARQDLDGVYAPMLRAPKKRVSDSLIPESTFSGRQYLEKLTYQINASYTYGLYDGAAALTRRLVEGLVIESFVHAKKDSVIKNADGSYFMLDALIGVIGSGKPIRLGRGKTRTLDKVKEVGDRAAHDRFYITNKQDIDGMATQLRALLSELKSKSGIQKKV